ncbi:hypothetical protein LINGRAHAP2_LOCUS29933 [Linum grandiflorum]
MAVALLLWFVAFLAFTSQQLGAAAKSQVVNGRVSCVDCPTTPTYDFSGILISVKCDGDRKLAVTGTEKDGSFQAELPSATPQNCLAKLLGGPTKLYASRSNLVSKIVKSSTTTSDDIDSYTISTPLAFSTTCPPGKASYCSGRNGLGSSKTVDLPIPKEWGLAPTSYYINPFVPIIGIP